MTQVQLTIRSSGHCFAEGHHVMKGAPKTPVRFEAIWAEIDHPTQGKILYDTGYTWRFLDATKRFPQRIYAELTKVSILPEEEAHRQVDPSQVKHLICSHIHADHVGGFGLVVMLAFGYAIAESLTNALGMRVQYQSFSMYTETGLARKKDI